VFYVAIGEIKYIEGLKKLNKILPFDTFLRTKTLRANGIVKIILFKNGFFPKLNRT